MTSLYKIADEYQEALNFLESCEKIDQQTVDDTLEGLKCEFKDKVINVAAYIKNLSHQLESIESVIYELDCRSHKINLRKHNLSLYLKNNMIKCGLDKIESPLFDVKISENPSKVDVYDEKLVPVDYYRVKEERSLDRILIKEMIKSGKEVPGACLVKDKKIVIK